MMILSDGTSNNLVRDNCTLPASRRGSLDTDTPLMFRPALKSGWTIIKLLLLCSSLVSASEVLQSSKRIGQTTITSEIHGIKDKSFDYVCPKHSTLKQNLTYCCWNMNRSSSVLV